MRRLALLAVASAALLAAACLNSPDSASTVDRVDVDIAHASQLAVVDGGADVAGVSQADVAHAVAQAAFGSAGEPRLAGERPERHRRRDSRLRSIPTAHLFATSEIVLGLDESRFTGAGPITRG